MRKAVVTLSLGPRPWFGVTFKWMLTYARRHGFDMVSLNTNLIDDLDAKAFTGDGQIGRMQKLGLDRLFEIYDRIVYLDDTCFVAPSTLDLTAIVPEAEIGCWIEGPSFADAAYLDRHAALYGVERLAPERLFHPGVLVLSREHRAIFEGWREHLEALAADPLRPFQGYASLAAREAGIPLHDIGARHNFTMGQIVQHSHVLDVLSQAQIVNLTGDIPVENRVEMALQFDEAFARSL